LETGKSGPGHEPEAATGGRKVKSPPASDAPGSPPDSTKGSPDADPSEDRTRPEGTTPEPGAGQDARGRLVELLGAYQETLDEVEDLPGVVWLPWARKGLGSNVKVPYLRWSLRYFVTYHIDRNLNALNRRYHAAAALADDPESNGRARKSVELFLRSLPSPPYRVLMVTAVLSALVIALPLQGFGNVFYLLDLVAALLRFDAGYIGEALEGGQQVGPAVRSVTVLLVGLTVVAAVLTSPFGLKRILFNLHPRTDETPESTAAREHVYRVEGIYALEDRVFEEAGIRRPREGLWDLMFLTFLLVLVLMFGLCLALLTLVILKGWNININLDAGAPGQVHFYLPQVSWVYYALFTALIFAAFLLLLRRLVVAWKKRVWHAGGRRRPPL
jgi:hypothetical protein